MISVNQKIIFKQTISDHLKTYIPGFYFKNRIYVPLSFDDSLYNTPKFKSYDWKFDNE